jgi:hypothetical protein
VGHCAPGPNAFVDCYASEALDDSGPLESWASGVLYDNVRIDGDDLRLGNRWSTPPKAGWSAANCALWQCQAANMICDRPPTANNWAIGIWATPAGNGVIKNLSEFVKPLSLYQQQLRERRGDEAAEGVGRFLLEPTGATNPTLGQAAEFVRTSNEPARRLIELIRERQANIPGSPVLRRHRFTSPRAASQLHSTVPEQLCRSDQCHSTDKCRVHRSAVIHAVLD